MALPAPTSERRKKCTLELCAYAKERARDQQHNGDTDLRQKTELVSNADADVDQVSLYHDFGHALGQYTGVSKETNDLGRAERICLRYPNGAIIPTSTLP